MSWQHDPRWRPLSEGWGLLVPLEVGGAAAALRGHGRLAVGLFLAAGGIALTLRDPERDCSPRPGAALAPADGTVVWVGRAWDEHLRCEMEEVAIFLSLFDVHVQRVPLDGVVTARIRRAGRYLPAMTATATRLNNQVSTYLDTAHGPCVVTQISGLVARRIVAWPEVGTQVRQGERLGVIKLSSQTSLRVPVGSRLLVGPGGRVVAGVTALAEMPATAELNVSGIVHGSIAP